jgi:uncharacterized tellurite resistance protein B-like protein
MINFFKNKEEKGLDKDESFSKIAALLIHAAKIDENYTNDEKEIIKETMIDLGVKTIDIDKIMNNATIIEENSNQILNFTKEIKNITETDKIKIIESLWKIIYSNNSADIYEANLMRRLAGLLYVDAKTMANLKDKIKKNLLK